MYTIYSAFFYAVSTLFFSEAGRIARKCLWQLALRYLLIYETTYHGMLRCSDEIQILSFYLVHHGIHFRKTHYSFDYIAMYHERRYTVCKAPVYHEIPCIGKYCRMQSRYITDKVIEAISCHPSCSIKIYAAEA